MNFDLEKSKQESFKDYKIRLCENKEKYDLTWTCIAALLNKHSGNSFSESTYRKWWKAYREGFEDASSVKKDDSDDVFSEKKAEFEKSKIKFYDERRAYNKLIRESARQENLKDIVCRSLKSLPKFEYFLSDRVDISNNDLFVGLNDIHYGANIDNFWNTYNPIVAKQRMEKYLSKIIEIKNIHMSQDCYVCANGDLISGKIHPTIEISNCENVVEQVKDVSELISNFLYELCQKFRHVYFSVVSGNHSRLGDKDKSPKSERLDDLIPWYVEARLSDIDNFDILNSNIDSTFNIVNIRGLNYVNVHGDYDGFSNIEKLTNMIPEDIYCVHFGHKHHNFMQWTNKYKVIMSGSLMGMDDYCIEKRIYGKAQQLVGVCTKDGMICTYDIDLQ